jgi:ORF6N domain-containing protein
MNDLVPIEHIESLIFIIRDRRVLVDATLAKLYGVTTKRLNQQVNRNPNRFPEDFAFTLTPSEKEELVAKCNRLRGLKFSTVMPRVFTEHGSIMAASVLNTPVAVRASIMVVRAFVRMRTMLAAHQDISARLVELEKKIGRHDTHIRGLFEAIRELMNPKMPGEPRRRIGYRAPS